jgi:SAM-dependent methyltransferase
LRSEFIELLSCSSCGSDLRLDASSGTSLAEDGHVLTGALHFDGCRAGYPINRGVPRSRPGDNERSSARDNTAARFGFEWNEFSSFDSAAEEAGMATWFQPRRPSDVAGLTVFDAGCGMGRHATVAASHGVARLVGIDLGSAVEAAFANTRQHHTVRIVQGDIYHPPLKVDAFDAGYSLGVLHHFPDPRRGFAALAPKVKPGGWFQVWVYGREGNGWLLYVLNPLRQITSRMPLRMLKLLSALIAAPVAIAAKTLYRIPGIGLHLPYADYMRWLARESLRKIQLIVFDQLIAPVAHYMPKDAVLDMVALENWTVQGIEHSRGMSWRVTVERRRGPTAESGAGGQAVALQAGVK